MDIVRQRKVVWQNVSYIFGASIISSSRQKWLFI